MTSSLPPCQYRVELTDQSVYCRHSQVVSASGLVPKAACRTCTVHATECRDPRPAAPPDLNERLPSVKKLVWNAAKAVAAFVADGARTVSPKEYRERMEICESCDRRRDDRCLECGCYLSTKAKGRVFQCPLEKWQKTTES